MKIKQLAIAFTLLLLSPQLFAQSTIEDFVTEGVQYHDNGDYENAIKSYKKALEIDSKSALANYEIGLSYFSNGNYEKAIKHTDIVIDQKGEYMLESYMTKGSALDLLGKSKESIKMFEKAIKKTDGHYLLYYNLALTHYKINNVDEAEENLIKAIEINPFHSSSHFVLAILHDKKGNSVQAILASHYFLLIEPNTQRSFEISKILQSNFDGDVSANDSTNSINISFSPNGDSQFAAVELMISLLQASKSLEENEGKTEDELFIENTESFFNILGELKTEKNTEIWWTFYTTFFYDLAKSDHLETYCRYITQSTNEDSIKWMNENTDKLNEFDQWFQNN